MNVATISLITPTSQPMGSSREKKYIYNLDDVFKMSQK